MRNPPLSQQGYFACLGQSGVHVNPPGDVAKLLDAVEDKAGPVAADNVLKRVSGICTWYKSRHEDYASPIVKGMRRSSTKERARDRTLTDPEICLVWRGRGG